MDIETAETLLTPIRPSEHDVRLARQGTTELSRLEERSGLVTVTVSAGKHKAEFAIPEIAFRMLAMILDQLKPRFPALSWKALSIVSAASPCLIPMTVTYWPLRARPLPV